MTVDQAINDVEYLSEASTQARQLTDDEPVASLQRFESLHQLPSLGGVLRGAPGLDELVHRQALLLGIVEDGQPLLVEVLGLG